VPERGIGLSEQALPPVSGLLQGLERAFGKRENNRPTWIVKIHLVDETRHIAGSAKWAHGRLFQVW